MILAISYPATPGDCIYNVRYFCVQRNSQAQHWLILSVKNRILLILACPPVVLAAIHYNSAIG